MVPLSSKLPEWVLDSDAPLSATDAASKSETGLLTIPEAAEALRVSTRTVSRFLRDNNLPALRIGRSVRIRRSDLEEFMRAHPSDSRLHEACRE